MLAAVLISCDSCCWRSPGPWKHATVMPSGNFPPITIVKESVVAKWVVEMHPDWKDLSMGMIEHLSSMPWVTTSSLQISGYGLSFLTHRGQFLFYNFFSLTSGFFFQKAASSVILLLMTVSALIVSAISLV